MKPFYVYLLQCADNSFYCGHTDDIERRLSQHHDGQIGYTAARKPVLLVWQGEFVTRAEAISFERRVKGWSRAKKAALVAGDWEQIKRLSRNHSVDRAPFDKLRANGVEK